MNVEPFGDWALTPEPPAMYSAPTAEGIAGALVDASVIAPGQRHAIEHAALGAAAEFVARGVDVSTYTFIASAGDGPDVVQLLFAPPFEDDRERFAAMLGDLLPAGALDGIRFDQ